MMAELPGWTVENREERLDLLIAESRALAEQAEWRWARGHWVPAKVALFSGGNDSTVLVHLMRDWITHVAHVNTGIGIEQTRDFVRATCEELGLPLIEKSPPPGSTYEELVLDQGFPGPAHHYKMYQRLKERALHEIRRDFGVNFRRDRIIYLAGRRRSESRRRANVPEMERTGSIIWVSPLVGWTSADMNTYRMRMEREGTPVPRNEVSDLLHMSGECLCGSFAAEGELDQIGMWFPEVKERIERLEEAVRATGKFPPERCVWGWGQQDLSRLAEMPRSGPLCASCDARLGRAVEEEG